MNSETTVSGHWVEECVQVRHTPKNIPSPIDPHRLIGNAVANGGLGRSEMKLEGEVDRRRRRRLRRKTGPPHLMEDLSYRDTSIEQRSSYSNWEVRSERVRRNSRREAWEVALSGAALDPSIRALGSDFLAPGSTPHVLRCAPSPRPVQVHPVLSASRYPPAVS